MYNLLNEIYSKYGIQASLSRNSSGDAVRVKLVKDNKTFYNTHTDDAAMDPEQLTIGIIADVETFLQALETDMDCAGCIYTKLDADTYCHFCSRACRNDAWMTSRKDLYEAPEEPRTDA